jgi:hypothetical protein
MKKLIIILTVILSNVSYCQTNYKNFEVVDGDFVWENVFETEMSIDELKYALKGEPFISDLEDVNGSYMGVSAKKTLDKDENGKNPINVQPYTGFVTIKFKDGKYKVTVEDIKFDAIQLGVVSGGISVSGSEDSKAPISYCIDNNGQIKHNKRYLRLLANIDYDLMKIFTVKNEIDSDW